MNRILLTWRNGNVGTYHGVVVLLSLKILGWLQPSLNQPSGEMREIDNLYMISWFNSDDISH